MIYSLRHFGLVVYDLERSLHFYCVLLGLRVVCRLDEEGPFLETVLANSRVKVTTVKLGPNKGVTLLELLKFKNRQSKKKTSKKLFNHGYTHFALSVNNLRLMYKRLLSQKVTFLSEPQRSPDGKVLVAFCKDPEGNWIELVEEITS